jgi:hypothetical protein
MMVSGDDAKHLDAIRLDTFEPVNKGELLEANEDTGFVRWKGGAGSTHTLTLGAGSIRIMKKQPRGR